jgi:transcriptional regulator with XRE-family HTH domain
MDLIMLIGHRLRELREAKNLSQGDIEQRTGLMRCYTSRVENERTVPSIETLAKYARALDLPLHMFFRERDESPSKNPNPPATKALERLWGSNGTESFELVSLANALSRMNERKRRLLLELAHRLAQGKREVTRTSG